MFVPIVALKRDGQHNDIDSSVVSSRTHHPPVILDIDDRINHFLVEPVTVGSCDQISPAPPALTQSAITTARDTDVTRTDLNTKNQRSLCGGMRRNGNWILQNKKWEHIC